jgi:hypothetical protein
MGSQGSHWVLTLLLYVCMIVCFITVLIHCCVLDGNTLHIIFLFSFFHYFYNFLTSPKILLTHIHTHTYIHTYTDTHTHTYTYIYTHTYTHTYIDTHTYTHTYIHTHIHTHTHTQTHTHIHVHTHTHIHTHIHMSECATIFFNHKNTSKQFLHVKQL